MSREAIAAAESMASTCTAAMSAKDKNATVQRIARTINSRFQVQQIESEELAERVTAEAINRSTKRMSEYTSNSEIFARNVALEQQEQEEVLPVFGPQYSSKKKRNFQWVLKYLLTFLLFLIVCGLFCVIDQVVASFPMWMLLVLFITTSLAFYTCSRFWREKQKTDAYLRSVHVRQNRIFGEVDENGLLMPETPIPTQSGLHQLANNVTNTLCLGRGDESKIDPKHEIKIEDRPCDKKSAQKGATLYSWSTRLSYVLASCVCNFHNALSNRHGVTQPKITIPFTHAEALLKSLLNEVQGYYLLEVTQLRDGDKWIQRWGLTKRLMILSSRIWDTIAPDRVSSFIKREVNHSRPSKARLIQGYENLATQALFAAEFAALQKAWGRVFNGTRAQDYVRQHGIDITFSSGMNHKDLGDWLRDSLELYPNAYFYERDGKNWDATMQDKHFDLKYLAFSVAEPEFLAFTRACFDVRGTAKNLRGGDKIKYRLCGTVKSGHNDTSSGNSLINAMIIFEAMKLRGLKGRIIVNGDDCLVVLDRKIRVDELSDLEKAMGIVPEARVFERWQDVSFLSGIWAPTGDVVHPYAFIPKPGRLLARCFWTVQTMSKKQMQTWAHDVASCILVGSRHVPVIDTFLSLGGHVTEDARPRTYNVAGRNYKDFQVVNPIERGGPVVNWFLDRYHITHQELTDVETWFLEQAQVVGILVHPVLERIQAVDNADIDVRELTWDI